MEPSIADTIESLIMERNIAMKKHDFTRVEAIAFDLRKINVNLKDTKDGTYWNFY